MLSMNQFLNRPFDVVFRADKSIDHRKLLSISQTEPSLRLIYNRFFSPGIVTIADHTGQAAHSLHQRQGGGTGASS